MVSKACDVVFLNRIFFKTPKNTKKSCQKQDPDNTESKGVRQDKWWGTVTTNFDTNDDASGTDSMDSAVPDTPAVNSNPGWCKYNCTYRGTMQYNPTTGHTIGAEATALANYYQYVLKKGLLICNLPNVGAV